MIRFVKQIDRFQLKIEKIDVFLRYCEYLDLLLLKVALLIEDVDWSKKNKKSMLKKKALNLIQLTKSLRVFNSDMVILICGL